MGLLLLCDSVSLILHLVACLQFLLYQNISCCLILYFSLFPPVFLCSLLCFFSLCFDIFLFRFPTAPFQDHYRFPNVLRLTNSLLSDLLVPCRHSTALIAVMLLNRDLCCPGVSQFQFSYTLGVISPILGSPLFPSIIHHLALCLLSILFPAWFLSLCNCSFKEEIQEIVFF